MLTLVLKWAVAGMIAITGVLFGVVRNGNFTTWSVERMIAEPHDELGGQWSPDGTMIAFVGHQPDPDVFVWDSTTGQVRNLSDDAEDQPDLTHASNPKRAKDDYAPLWSPDSQYIAFMRRGQPTEIRVVEVATGAIYKPTEQMGNTNFVGWTGHDLIIQQGTRLFSYEVATQARQDLYVLAEGEYFSTTQPSPDGNWVAVVIGYAPNPKYRALLVNMAGGQLATYELGGSIISDFVWSNDSRYLAYSTRAAVSGTTSNPTLVQIYDTATLMGQSVFILQKGGIEQFSWSYENQLMWLSVVPRGQAYPPESDSTIVVWEAFNKPPRPLLTIEHGIKKAEWSPTRRHIAFQTYGSVYVADVETGLFSQVFGENTIAGGFLWSRDGDYLAVYGSAGSPSYQRLSYIIDIQYPMWPMQVDFNGWSAQWSPVEDRLLFHREAGAGSPTEVDVYVVVGED